MAFLRPYNGEKGECDNIVTIITVHKPNYNDKVYRASIHNIRYKIRTLQGAVALTIGSVPRRTVFELRPQNPTSNS